MLFQKEKEDKNQINRLDQKRERRSRGTLRKEGAPSGFCISMKYYCVKCGVVLWLCRFCL